jgi:HoxN/HupN/NixA family high-affinity nickel-transporter
LRHAFDADHISAIDNCTRKVLGERQGTGAPRPLGFGFFFSLGHSTVVVAIGAGIVVAEKTVFGAVSDSGSGLERFGGLFGTVVSAAFLLLIGLLNLVVLAGIVRVFRSMRRGEYDEAELERQLANRGFFYRFFGRWMKVITKEWQLYPVGVVFGLGFDTATEVALLATTGLLASQHIPWYAIICLPVLFTAGMTFMDTTAPVRRRAAAFSPEIDHTYESFATAFPDGRVTTCLAREAPRRGQGFWEKVVTGRAADVSCVRGDLTGAHPAWPGAGLIDPSRMAMAGHSAGGAAAIAAMLADSRVRAGVDMDGSTTPGSQPAACPGRFCSWASNPTTLRATKAP